MTQPRWSPDGTLHFISDRTGWYNLYADGDPPSRPLEAEFAGPDWVFGESSYAFLPDGRLVATWSAAGPTQLGVIGAAGLQPLDLPFTSFSSLAACDGDRRRYRRLAHPHRPPSCVSASTTLL